MKNFIKENWFKVGLLVMLIISIISIFYWFELRPSQIRKQCIKTYPDAFRALTDDNGFGSLQSVGNWKGSIDKFGYKKCLIENGLEK